MLDDSYWDAKIHDFYEIPKYCRINLQIAATEEDLKGQETTFKICKIVAKSAKITSKYAKFEGKCHLGSFIWMNLPIFANGLIAKNNFKLKYFLYDDKKVF